MSHRKPFEISANILRSFHCKRHDIARAGFGSRPCWRTGPSTNVRRTFATPSFREARANRSQANTRTETKTAEESSPPLNLVPVTVDGETHGLSPIWLRDLCQCSRCVDPSTRQKHFATVDIPETIHANEVIQGPDSVSITWTNDIPGHDENHATTIAVDTLRNMLVKGDPLPPERSLSRSPWSVQQFTKNTGDFDYDAYMTDDSVLFAALKQLKVYGLLFVKNVPEDGQSVETLAERIGPLKTTFYGRTWDVRSVPEAKNVAYTSQNLGFHMDLMYMVQPPHLQLLHCIRSSANGGASLFSDALKAAVDMANQHRAHYDILRKSAVTYHYDHAENQYMKRRHVIGHREYRRAGRRFIDYHDYLRKRRNQDPKFGEAPELTPLDFINELAWSPPFQGPFKLKADESGLQIKKWHEAARIFSELIHQPGMVYERMMKPGECVIFDNRRVLHARKAFEVGDAGKERWLKGAYIDKDPYMSKLKILMDQHEPRAESGDANKRLLSQQQEQVSAALA